MAEIRHLGCWRQNAKTCFPGKLSNLVSCNWAFQRTHYWIPKISDGWDPPSWKWTWRLFFCQDGPIWIKCWRLLQNDMSTATMCSKSKPGVEFQYGGNLGEFNRNHITSHGENGSRPQRPLYPRNNDRLHFILHKILYYNTTVSDAMEICFVIIHHVLIDPEFI